MNAKAKALLLTASLGPSLLLDFTTGSLDPRVTFTRASSATYFDVNGTLQTAGSNVPRFDYDPVTLAAKGLLIETQSTNLLLNNAALSTQSVTVTATVYTLSFYGTGTVTLSGASTGSLVGTGAFPSRASLSFTPSAGTLTLTVSGSVQSAQLEQLPSATSVIATLGSTVTRAGDAASFSSPIVSSFNGTLQINGQSSLLAGSADFGGIGTDTNNIYIDRVFFVNSTTVKGQLVDIVGGTVFSGINSAATATNGSMLKTIISYNPVSQAIVWNGSSSGVGIGAIAAQPPMSKIFIGSGRVLAPSNWISKVVYWRRKLSVMEMARATQ